jgi:uncharacterized membrane protein YhaH (DUF805 family)
MTAVWFFIGFSGRISRSQWWLGMLGVAVAMGMIIAIALSTASWWLALPFILFVPVALYALAARRLHDRGKSGWWTLAFLWIPGVLDRISDRLTEESPLWWVLVLIGSALTIWGVIELGFRRGTDGDNEYGPDPLAQREPAGEPEITR